MKYKFWHRIVQTGIQISFYLFFSQAVSSATITITSGSDDNVGCTLREAIESINEEEDVGGCSSSAEVYGSNDTVSTVGIDTVTITEGEILIQNTIRITGSPSAMTTIQGDNTSRFIRFSNPAVGSNLSALRFTMGDKAVSGSADGLTIDNCLFEGNTGVSGAAINVSGDNLTVINTVFKNNTGSALGGALFSSGDFLTIENSVFEQNAAGTGGAAYLVGSAKSINNSSFSQNTASTAGAIYFQGNDSLISASTFNKNSATFSHGGAMVLLGSNVDIVNTTVSENTALASTTGVDLDAGGIDSLANNLRIINSTIVDNRADEFGGGIKLGFNATEIRNSIISGNVASDGNEIYYQTAPVLENNILGTNAVSLAEALQEGASDKVTSISSTNILATKRSLHSVSLAQIINPLSNNGGLTQTHALAQDSPAGNTGDNLTCQNSLVNGVDQIGQVRPFASTCDIGAFESQLAIFDGDADGVATGFDNCPLDENPDQLDSNNNGIGDVCEDTELCFPIVAKNKKIALICL